MKMENALESRGRVPRQKRIFKRKHEKSGKKIVESESGNREGKVQQENNKKKGKTNRLELLRDCKTLSVAILVAYMEKQKSLLKR